MKYVHFDEQFLYKMFTIMSEITTLNTLNVLQPLFASINIQLITKQHYK